MYQILVVEDQPEQCSALCKILEAYDSNLVIHRALDFSSALKELQSTQFDLFFLDYKLNESFDTDKTGITLGHEIRSIQIYQYTPIIFVTSIPEKIQEALNDTGCFRYILKPYDEEDIFNCLDSVLHSLLVKPPAFTFHSFWGGQISIPESSILYFCPGVSHRLCIVTDAGRYETLDYTLNQLETMMKHNFIRCHRRYLINLKKISNYDCTNRLLYVAGQAIPLGRNYKATFENVWSILK